MKKDAYYFPHFSNARNDSKLTKLRRVLGIEGYGMYFLILEVLREQTDFTYPLSGLEDLAYDWHTSKEKLQAVVLNFELFEINEDVFLSPKLILYLKPYLEKSERARQAALKRWNDVKAMQMHTKSDANAIPAQCNGNANQNAKRGEESKREESKENIEKKEKYVSAFEIFWNKYDKKNDRSGCLKKWMKLTKDEINEIFRTIDDYIVSTPDKQYRKNPKTYLNNKSWLDEIIEKEKSSAKKEKDTAYKAVINTSDNRLEF